MKIKIIRLEKDKGSLEAAEMCKFSCDKHNLEAEYFNAITPDQVVKLMAEHEIQWSYPWNGEEAVDLQTGLRKVGYKTAEPQKRIACFLSHYLLWKECAESGEDMIILEHDAFLEKKVPFDRIAKSGKTIVGLNRPQPGATPRADIYANKVRAQIPQGENNQSPARICEIPYIWDDRTQQLPAGLPGNSAYYIKPKGALKMLELTKTYGAWPNDALMCKQLLPRDLGIIWPYVARVQMTRSTTTL